MMTNFTLIKENASDFFELINLQVDPTSNLDDVAMQLRGLCVREWKETHISMTDSYRILM